jgi:hypothetical protein
MNFTENLYTRKLDPIMQRNKSGYSQQPLTRCNAGYPPVKKFYLPVGRGELFLLTLRLKVILEFIWLFAVSSQNPVRKAG